MATKNLEFLEIPREMPLKQHARVRIGNFREIYGKFNQSNAASQSSRCIECGNPYCEWKCPVHNFIPNWLDLVQKGELFRACELLHLTNSLPEVCGRICPQDRLCEGACTINDGFGAVTIGSVEKYIADEAIARGWRPDISRIRSSGSRVAIVGAGPAGLACADVLTRNGVKAIVYDRYPRVGGLLTYGIPAFKLEKEVIHRRQGVLEGMGVEFRCGVEIGKDIALDSLVKEHDAVFLGMGTYTSRDGQIPGQDHPEVYQSLPYLIGNINHIMDWPAFDAMPYVSFKDKRVLVLGGGDTAMDCVRSAIRQKARRVICAYRREEKNMPGSATEVRNARDEGVRFLWNLQPSAVRTEGDKLIGVDMTVTSKDSSGRLVMTGKKKLLRADCVVIAFGFESSAPAWLGENGIDISDRGLVLTGAGKHPHQSTADKIFAGGDMTRGSDLVVTAVYEGREAAKGISSWLNLPSQIDESPFL